MQMRWIVLGAILAVIFILAANRTRCADKTIAAGLLVAAVIYVGFATFGGAGAGWMAIEFLGVAVYGVFAWLGVNRSSVWLAAGWMTHIAWDVGLHQVGSGRIFTPDWYPPLCIGFDVVVAVCLVWTASKPKPLRLH